MIKLICLVICTLIAFSAAENPSWYPTDLNAIIKKCNEKHLLPTDFKIDVSGSSQIGKTKWNDVFLCRLKESNVYDNEAGLDVDRLKFLYETTRKSKCDKHIVQECIDENMDLTPEGDGIFEIVMCLANKDTEMYKNGC